MQPETRQDKINFFNKILNIILIISVLIVIVCAGLWIYAIFNNNSDDGKVSKKMAALLESDITKPRIKKFSSNLGFSVDYNTQYVKPYGYFDNSLYQNKDLDTKRAYDVVRFKPVESLKTARNSVTLSEPNLRITTNRDSKFWIKLQDEYKKDYLAKKEAEKNKDKAEDKKTESEDKKESEIPKKTEIDLLVDVVLKQKKSEGADFNKSKIEDIKIDSKTYKKINFEYVNKDFSVESKKTEECYITVQNSRPYVACINNIRAYNFSTVSVLQSLLSNINYEKVDDQFLSKNDEETNSIVSDEKIKNEDNEAKASVKSGLDKSTKESIINKDKISDYLKSSFDFSVFAKNSPSVVRVAALYCADIELKASTGGRANLTDACLEKIGSGFFIGSGGQVATSGKNISIKPSEVIRAYVVNSPYTQTEDRLQRVLDFMNQARIITSSDVDNLMIGVSEGNQDAIEKVYSLADKISPDDIRLKEKKKSYAIQTSNKPISISGENYNKSEFSYSDDVLEAELIANRYTDDISQYDIFEGKIPSDDVAILKVKKPSYEFPALSLSDSYNIGKSNNLYNIGYLLSPGFGIGDRQMINDVSYEFGKAVDTRNIDSTLSVSKVKVDSLSGFGGSPLIGGDNKVYGVASFNNLNCNDAKDKCFQTSLIRSVQEIQSTLKDKNIPVSSSSVSKDIWYRGVDELIQGNFAQAKNYFDKSAKLYPGNYFAKRFSEYSSSMIGSEKDTSTINTIEQVSKIVLIVFIAIILVLTIIKFYIRLFVKPKIVSQYGYKAKGNYIDKTQWNAPQQNYSAVPSVMQQNYTPMNNYQNNNQPNQQNFNQNNQPNMPQSYQQGQYVQPNQQYTNSGQSQQNQNQNNYSQNGYNSNGQNK